MAARSRSSSRETSGSPSAGAAPREAPIGVFDSGIGGLTVAAEIAQVLPSERIVYVADQAHVPYGGRPIDEVRDLASMLCDYLFREEAKTVVMACNISSATALGAMRAKYGHGRVVGVIEAGVSAALESPDVSRIGVLATTGTVATRAYTSAISKVRPEIEVIEVACPRFVPLVEAGLHESDQALVAAREALEPLRRRGAQIIILGCTHYPFLISALRRAADPATRFIDPARATAMAVARMLEGHDLLAGDAGATDRPPHRLLTTGREKDFLDQLQRFWAAGAFVTGTISWAEIACEDETRRDRLG